MFADLAPRMRARGWPRRSRSGSLEKRPVFHKWQAFNKRPPSEKSSPSGCVSTEIVGVGYAFGLDGVIGVDLDWTDPDKAARAWEITKDICGDTPLIRSAAAKEVGALPYDPARHRPQV